MILKSVPLDLLENGWEEKTDRSQVGVCKNCHNALTVGLDGKISTEGCKGHRFLCLNAAVETAKRDLNK